MISPTLWINFILGLNLDSKSTFRGRSERLSSCVAVVQLRSFLALKPPSLSEWHLLVSWAGSLSTCWYHLFALRSFPTLALPTRNVAFQQSLIAHGGRSRGPAQPEGRRSSSLCVRKTTMKDRRPRAPASFQAAIASADLSRRLMCVLWVR